MNRDVFRQVVNVAALLITLVVNTLANALPLNGITTGEISDRFQVFFVPAGYVFSIWFVIYLALIAFTVYQALPAQRENAVLRRVGYLFALSCAANTAWIFLWHYGYLTATVFAMLILLVSLITIYLRLDIGRATVSPADRWLVHLPFSIYLGWITVATVANITDWLWAAGWNGFGIAPALWAVIMLLVGAIIAALMSLTRRDIAYNAVIVWAFIGIAVKQWNTPLVAIVALIMAGAVIGILFGTYWHPVKKSA